MKFKRFFPALLAGSAAILAMASCDAIDDGENGENGTDDKTISFYTTAGDTPMVALNAAKAKYEEANPGWTVNIVNGFSFDTLRTKITEMLTSNTQPSLAYCYPDHVANYLKTGQVLNMQTYIDNAEYGYSAEEWADFVPSYMEEGHSYSVEGTYSIPMARSTEVLYYNKTVLDKLSIAVPTTWSELWNACAKLKAAYPKSTPFTYDSDDNWMITMLEQYSAEHGGTKYYTDGTKTGEERIIFNNDVTKSILTELKGYYDKGYFTTKGVSGKYGSALFTTYDPKTTVDSTYDGSFMTIGSTGGATKQGSDNFTVAVAGVPGYTTTNAKCIQQGPSLCMFNQGSDEKAVATWKFVKVLLSTEIQAKYSIDNGYNPVRQSVYTNAAFEEAMDEGTVVNKTILFAKNLATKNLFYTSEAFVGSAEARTQIGTALTNVLKATDTSTISSELQNASDEAKYYAKRG